MKKTYRIVVEAVFDIEADSEEEAYGKLPAQIPIEDTYTTDFEELGEDEEEEDNE